MFWLFLLTYLSYRLFLFFKLFIWLNFLSLVLLQGLCANFCRILMTMTVHQSLHYSALISQRIRTSSIGTGFLVGLLRIQAQPSNWSFWSLYLSLWRRLKIMTYDLCWSLCFLNLDDQTKYALDLVRLMLKFSSSLS